MPERHRGKLIGLGALLVIVIGFVLVKPATPIISVAAEPIIEGGYEITNTMISAWVIMVVLAIVVFWLYRRLRNVEEALVPRGLQNVVEALLDALFNVVKLVAGEKNGRHFFPVVASIFLILLVANWFGLFPWNNSFGRTVDLRFEYIEALEKDVEDVVAGPEGTGLSAAQVNRTFSTFYFDPIPFEASELDEADVLIAAALRDEVSGSERAVREFFREDPVPAGMEGAALIEATEERLEEALAAFGVSPALLERYGAATEAVALERALVFNLPLSLAAVDESELHGAVINSGGVNVVPIKADDFAYDPFLEKTIAGADGRFGGRARIFDPLAEGEENVPPGSGEVALPVTLNTAHVGIILKQVREDVIGIEAGEIARSMGVGGDFPAVPVDRDGPESAAGGGAVGVHFRAAMGGAGAGGGDELRALPGGGEGGGGDGADRGVRGDPGDHFGGGADHLVHVPTLRQHLRGGDRAVHGGVPGTVPGGDGVLRPGSIRGLHPGVRVRDAHAGVRGHRGVPWGARR